MMTAALSTATAYTADASKARRYYIKIICVACTEIA